ncbi:bifunctional 3-(3-hydroxy-phenyl)propionate/3-hydroxycinnamic acid hydroxylase [Tsukamurella pseudospumae]|uniref:3-(3-hydroxyphenyl)propionate hydroxylase n=1 Tax=Tsukamurella pseudospumae TaxID=239498 RepID=A0A138A7Q1_9ACTN|nr:bifunctional 3-(3-hydroxy-phenyl)propionate/3-hydroxycinnamic acid hydroxylase [Tsukamurella pseudospumae]KXO99179.1 3-(3-hydroxyphenyl)propionate hydroxylase [Tsukamurella pseudospumae]KXP06466.1 3-(3-hydroxyphenyl)propionate hydroxylase [Tsukamurella pseudospumae]
MNTESTTTTDYDVAVIGYGPTGLVLSSMLARAGHRVVAVERWPGLYGMPRLTHIDGETARIIQAAGDVDSALRDAAPAAVYEWRNGAEELLIAVDWSGESSGFAAHYSMYQPHIECSIDERNRTRPNLDVLQGTILVSMEQSDDHVELVVRPWSRDRDAQWADAPERTLTAQYVVGADGAGSTVRHLLGIDRSDLHVDDRWLNIDTECVRPLGDRFDTARQYCDPRQPHMFMPIGRSRQRFEVAVRPEDDADEMATEEFAWRWLRAQHDLGPDDVKILRHIVYTFSACTADAWRAGRVFLAGDAAHTMPPYMGQGACSGMRDGITLAWKLDLVLSGRAGEALLDTYEAERRPHVEVIQNCAVELGRVANLKDPVAAAARDIAFQRGEVPPLPPFPTIAAGVIDADADGLPVDVAGTLAPQGVVRLADDRSGRFDDLHPWGFAVVSTRDATEILGPDRLTFLAELGGTVVTLEPGHPHSIVDEHGTYAAYFADTGADAFLVRPDFHLYGAAGLADLPRLVDGLRVKLSAAPAVAVAR